MFDKSLRLGIGQGMVLGTKREKRLRGGAAAIFAIAIALVALPATPVYARSPVQAGIPLAALPAEAINTLSLMKKGGPFPYSKDGAVFGNYERQLPQRQRGYYHEFTVPTPRARNRGVQRIIVGGTPPDVDYFYTNDHYASFQRIQDK